LAVFVPLATLGVYNATIIAFNVLSYGIAGSIAAALFSAYSAMTSTRENQNQELSDAVRRASRYIAIAIAPLALGLMATAKPALLLFVGSAYAEGAGVLMILSGVFAFTVVGTAMTSMLLALGQTRSVSGITVTSVVVGLVVAIVLVPVWGMLGAAISRGITMILATSLTVLALRGKLNQFVDLEATWKSLISGIVMALVVMGMQVLLNNAPLLPLHIFVGALTYVAVLRELKTLRPEDIDFIARYTGKRLAFLVKPLSRIFIRT
jgi:O-antigen/teichoic acid export membrane protein